MAFSAWVVGVVAFAVVVAVNLLVPASAFAQTPTPVEIVTPDLSTLIESLELISVAVGITAGSTFAMLAVLIVQGRAK